MYRFLLLQGKKAKKAERSAAAKPVDQRLNHSLDILGAFAKLKIEVPLTTSQVGGATWLQDSGLRDHRLSFCMWALQCASPCSDTHLSLRI